MGIKCVIFLCCIVGIILYYTTIDPFVYFHDVHCSSGHVIMGYVYIWLSGYGKHRIWTGIAFVCSFFASWSGSWCSFSLSTKNGLKMARKGSKRFLYIIHYNSRCRTLRKGLEVQSSLYFFTKIRLIRANRGDWSAEE